MQKFRRLAFPKYEASAVDLDDAVSMVLLPRFNAAQRTTVSRYEFLFFGVALASSCQPVLLSIASVVLSYCHVTRVASETAKRHSSLACLA